MLLGPDKVSQPDASACTTTRAALDGMCQFGAQRLSFMVSQVDVKNRLESVVLVVFRIRVSVGRIIPGVKAGKIGSGFYCFDVSSAVSSLKIV